MTTLTNQPVVHGGDRSLRSESGIALIIALMAMLFMMALGTVLMLSTTTETKIANNFRNSSEALYAADAGLERSMDDLLTIPDWNSMLDGAATSAFIDGAPGDRQLCRRLDAQPERGPRLRELPEARRARRPTIRASRWSARGARTTRAGSCSPMARSTT